MAVDMPDRDLDAEVEAAEQYLKSDQLSDDPAHRKGAEDRLADLKRLQAEHKSLAGAPEDKAARSSRSKG